MKVVWSDYCGQMRSDGRPCGKLEGEFCLCPYCDFSLHEKAVSQCKNSQAHHQFVRVPLNFDEWRKDVAHKVAHFRREVAHGISDKDWVYLAEIEKSLLEGLK